MAQGRKVKSKSLRVRLVSALSNSLRKLGISRGKGGDIDAPPKRVLVTEEEILAHNRKRGKSPYTRVNMFESSDNDPIQDMTTELIMNGIQDGIFRAQLLLADLPCGELMMILRDNRVVLATRPHRALSHFIPRVHVRLPSFLNTSSLETSLDLMNDMLLLSASVKGFVDTRVGSAGSIQGALRIRRSASGPSRLNRSGSAASAVGKMRERAMSWRSSTGVWRKEGSSQSGTSVNKRNVSGFSSDAESDASSSRPVSPDSSPVRHNPKARQQFSLPCSAENFETRSHAKACQQFSLPCSAENFVTRSHAKACQQFSLPCSAEIFARRIHGKPCREFSLESRGFGSDRYLSVANIRSRAGSDTTSDRPNPHIK